MITVTQSSARTATPRGAVEAAGMCFSGFTSPTIDSAYPTKSPYEEHGGKIPMKMEYTLNNKW